MTNEGQSTLLDNTSTILIGGFTTIAAALTAFGAVSGGLTRMLRNYPILSLSAAVLISVAIGLGIGAKAANAADNTRLAYELIGLGILSFVASLICATVAATQAPHGLERPQITAKLTNQDGLTLVGEVKAEDLPWGDFVEVTVLAAKLTIDKPNEIKWETQRYLYISHTGPDTDGKVDMTFNVPIRPEESWGVLQVTSVVAQKKPAPLRCAANAPNSLACLAVRLSVPRRPQVAATWSTTGAHPTLTVTTKAQDLPATGLIRTTVVTRSRHNSTMISQAVISPDINGNVAHSQKVPINSGSRTVCVIAERLSPGVGQITLPRTKGTCPASTDQRVTEMLAVPVESTVPADRLNRLFKFEGAGHPRDG
jgi:hypothetical protein